MAVKCVQVFLTRIDIECTGNYNKIGSLVDYVLYGTLEEIVC